MITNLELKKFLNKEKKYQKTKINLIASENYVSKEILNANSSILINQNFTLDSDIFKIKHLLKLKQYANKMARKIFNAEYSNIEPLSGSQANEIAFFSLLKPGDKIFGMDIKSGGHLSHGTKISFSGIYYESESYNIDANGILNYNDIEKRVIKFKPKLIICGASSYSRIINWKKFSDIAKKVNAYLVVDIAHVSGLIAAKLHPNPIPFADIVTSTTHKTLRGPRGGIIFAKKKYKKIIENTILIGFKNQYSFNSIYSKLLCFLEADSKKFIIYQKNVLLNSITMCNFFRSKKIPIISDYTENHLFIINVKKGFGITGIEAEKKLEKYDIICNKNFVYNDKEPANLTSGIRIGTPAITTIGYKKQDCLLVAKIIYKILKLPNFSRKIYEQCKKINTKFV